MQRFVFIAAILATATAYAGPFKETLSKDEITKAVKAVQAALPPVDAAARTKCQPMLDEYNSAPESKPGLILSAAECFRAAGALGASIMMFQTAYKYPVKGKGAETLRELAAAQEAAAIYDGAAEHYEAYWGDYGPGTLEAQADAAMFLVRATCIRRQLGDESHANADFKSLASADHKTRYDANKLCDAIRPIAMPAKAP
ncbi:MAG TPA: hypothetical protein VGM90_27735 [Kofleriaceae bacterium]|jgi:hypothetical protein